MDVYSFLATSPSPVVTAQEQTISEVINESGADVAGGHLNQETASHIVCLLSQKVDKYERTNFLFYKIPSRKCDINRCFCCRLFEEAALKLNLTALMGFVKDLCSASHQQLFSRTPNAEKYTKWWKLKAIEKSNDVQSDNHSLFLSRINQVMLKCIRSGRPLLHIMKIWSLVGPHYIEVIP